MYKEYGWNDGNINSTNYIYPKLVQCLRQYNAHKILDMGCGNGEIANKLIDEGFCVYGVDASDEGVCIANKYHSGHFFVMDFERDSLPAKFQNIDFDTVISTEVIEHMYSPYNYIEQIRKVLCGGGRIYITTPYHGYIKNLLISIMGKWDAHFTALWEGGHIKFWSRNTITKLLENSGFKIEKYIGCGRIPYLWKSMLIVACLKDDT